MEGARHERAWKLSYCNAASATAESLKMEGGYAAHPHMHVEGQYHMIQPCIQTHFHDIRSCLPSERRLTDCNDCSQTADLVQSTQGDQLFFWDWPGLPDPVHVEMGNLHNLGQTVDPGAERLELLRGDCTQGTHKLHDGLAV